VNRRYSSLLVASLDFQSLRRVYQPKQDVCAKGDSFNALVLSQTSLSSSVAFFSDGEFDTLALGQRDPWLGSSSNDKDVRGTGGKRVTQSILDVNNVETSVVTFTVNNASNTSNVATTSNEGQVASFKLDKVFNLSVVNVELDGVVDCNGGVRVTNGATVVRNQVRNSLGAQLNLLHFAQLVLREN